MYKLIRFEAVNVAGFKSGLGKKTVKIDLSKLQDKSIIVIQGNNATGKSTLLSLIHPTHLPTDKRSKFILKGREGMVEHEYLGLDGTRIITTAIFTPKGDSHTAKLYFKLIKRTDETELNPSGNVNSYYSLLYTYFGINKDFIQFASYNDVVKGIVSMTDQQRKMSVATMIPNTNRFEAAYNIINEKYKDLNSRIRNLTQKITHLGNEDEMEHSLKLLNRDLKDLQKKHDKTVRIISESEGKMKLLAGDTDPMQITLEYEKMRTDELVLTERLLSTTSQLLQTCNRLDKNTVVTNNNLNEIMDKLTKQRIRFQAMQQSLSEQKDQYQFEINRVTTEISDIDDQISQYESRLFGLQSQSVDELKQQKTTLQKQLDTLQYNETMASGLKDMDYAELSDFIQFISRLQESLKALSLEAGEWFQLIKCSPDQMRSRVEQLFSDNQETDTCISQLDDELEILRAKISEYRSYSGLRDILKQRPATCTDDSCPFIAHALKWNTIAPKLDEAMRLLNDKIAQQKMYHDRVRENNDTIRIIENIRNFQQLIISRESSIQKYLSCSISQLLSDISTQIIPSCFDILRLRNLLTLLSERAVYDNIIKNHIPSLESQIALAKNVESSRDTIQKQLMELKSKRETKMNRVVELRDAIRSADFILSVQKHQIEGVLEMEALRKRYEDILSQYESVTTKSEKMGESVEQIQSLLILVRDMKNELHEIDEEIRAITPNRDRLAFDLTQLKILQEEKKEIEKNFIILGMLRKISAPGKGIWKEAIDIYMEDIRDVANQLLSHMFDGQLVLNDFIINETEFTIPYTANGNPSSDIVYASSSQQTTISNAISLAIISKLLDRYGILTFDEVDKDLSPANKEVFVKILATQMEFIGIQQCFAISHNPQYYKTFDCGYLLFPGSDKDDYDEADYIEV